MTTLMVGSLCFDPRRLPTIPKDPSALIPGLSLRLDDVALAPFAFAPGAAAADIEPIDLGDWREWLPQMFPQHTTKPFGPFHAELWDWVWALTPGVRPPPFVAVWSRKFGKSSSAELACAAVGAGRKRRYGLYVCGTQDRANDHVNTVATLLESDTVTRRYPDLGARLENKFGYSRGWRSSGKSRVRTASGFTLDALGLDVAVRGIKLDAQRPDLIILDDLDDAQDTPELVEKKLTRLTQALFPAGADDVAILAVQNVVLPEGIFARLAGVAREPADFLQGRKLSGPIPAVQGLVTEQRGTQQVITAGTPSWAGFTLVDAQAEIDAVTLPSFLAEYQHNVRRAGDKLFDLAWWDGRNRFDPAQPPGIVVARVIGWDTGEAEGEHAASSAAAVIEVRAVSGAPWPYIAILREVYTGRWSSRQLLKEIGQYTILWHRDRKLRDVPIENASFGKAIIPMVRDAAPQELRAKIRAVPPVGSKDARLTPTSLYASEGRFWLPQNTLAVAHWLPDTEAELEALPHSRFRDKTDAIAHAMNSPWVRRHLTRPGVVDLSQQQRRKRAA